MIELWDQIIIFFHAYGWWIAIASIIMFIVSIASMPLILARIPVDYFTLLGHQRLRQEHQQRHPVLRLLLACIKNTLGALLLTAGIIMLFTPGQGLLSILFGLMIMNYPGKYRLECAIIRKPLVFNTINTMRKKQNYPALLHPDL